MFASDTDAKIAELENQIDQLRTQVALNANSGVAWLGGEQHGGISLIGDEGGASYVDNGCFKIAGTSGLELTLRNCLFMVGGKFHDELGSGANYEATFTLDASMPVLAVEIDTESSSSSTLVDFASIASLKTACEGELLKYYLPLYEFAIEYDATSQTYSVSVKRDLRNIPTAAMMEV